MMFDKLRTGGNYMLNKEKRVLIVNAKMEDIRNLFRFEAIEVITREEEIEPTWLKNKTPLMISSCVNEKRIRKYPILTVDINVDNFNPDLFIEFCHKNQIESGEYLTGEKFKISKESCFLCKIANYRGMRTLADYNQNVEEINDMIIYESENFYIKIEYGCLKRGMVMICPKFHVLSVANIPDKYMEEYMQVMRDIEYLLKGIYGEAPVIFFEHGSASNGIATHKSSVVHAHTHVAWGVPFEKKYLDMVCLKPARDIRDFKDRKYMSYQEGTDGQLLVVADSQVYIQRQYPRQVIGDMLGIEPERTNWRDEPFMENMVETFEDFYQFFIKNKTRLPKRILQATQGFIEGYEKRRNMHPRIEVKQTKTQL